MINDGGEPIPPFESCNQDALASALSQPFHTFDGKLLYRGFARKAAILVYGIIKNHCFENGNKRLSVAILLVFTYQNKRWIFVEPHVLEHLALVVADSKRHERDEIVDMLERFFEENAERLDL